MVTVKRYTSSQSLRGVNQQGRTSNASASAFGADIGQGLQQLGQGIDSVAGAMEAKEIVQAEADARQAMQKYRDLTRSGLYDPETGYLNTMGDQALGEARENTHSNLAAARDDIAAGLSPRARRVFEQSSQALDNSSKDSTIRHESVEFKNFTLDTFEAEAQSYLDAAATADSPYKFSANLGAAKVEVRRAGQLAGKPPEAIEQDLQRLDASAHAGRVVHLAENNPVEAFDYLREHEEEIKAGDPAQYEKLRNGLEPAYYRSRARETVDGSGGVQGHNPRTTNTQIVTYANQGATRNQPLSRRMTGAMEVLGDLGLGFEVFSGGQPGIETGSDQRVGSTRHDHGNAADGFFTKDGKRLSWKNPGERAMIVEGLQALKAAGMTGFGAGPGYMQEGSVHIGFGQEAVWGADGAGENAPAWLVEAMAEVEAGETGVPTGTSLPPSTVGMTLADAMRIEDPKLRDATIAEIETRRGAIAADRTWRRSQALEDAWTQIENGTRPDQLPSQLQVELGQETMNSIFNTYERNQAGVDYTDEERYQEIFDMSISDRQAFESMDLNEERELLSQSDLRELKSVQAELRSQTATVREQGAAAVIYTDTDYRQAMTDAEDQYRAATGIAPGTKMTQEQLQRYNRFTAQLRRGMTNYANENAAKMTFEERTNYVSTLLEPVIIEGVNESWGRENHQLFDLPTYRSQQELATDPRAELQLDTVPPNELAQIEQEFMQVAGRRPTEDEAVEIYEDKLFLSMGMSPNVEWADVPRDMRRTLMNENPGATKEEMADIFKQQVLQVLQGQQPVGPRR